MTGTGTFLAQAFAAAMERVGPFEPHPVLGVAVSGGADSTALAILASDWTQRRDGSTLALVVDHGLRSASADEARMTVGRLARLGIPARLLRVTDLKHGPALAERARILRYEILSIACRDAGILHLLLGHHAADQAETVAMRVLRGSQTHGLAAMPALRETPGLRLLRPLLAIDPPLLRDFLRARAVDWIEDPSNHDMRATRPRLRHRFAEPRGDLTRGNVELRQAISAVGRLRSRDEADIAAELANRVMVRPEGFALLSPGRISSTALSRLVQTIGGKAYPPMPSQINDLAAQPRPATIAGVRIMSAGRLGEGLLIVREEAAVMQPVEVSVGATWDNRFRVISCPDLPATGATIGKLGADAARFRGRSDLPSVVLRTLPAIRSGKTLVAVPHFRYVTHGYDTQVTVLFSPPRPVAGPCFVPAE